MTSPRLPSARRPGRLAVAGSLALACTLLGCQDGMGPTDGQRFGQLGEVRVDLVSPQGEAGELRQTLVWRSSGEWRLSESLWYEGRLGERHDVASSGDPVLSAGEYAQWITLVNETTGIEIIGYEPLDEDLDPACRPFQTRLTLSISDEVLDETRDWIRCAERSLASLDPRGSGPDAAAGRVVQAVQIMRDRTVNAGDDFRSAYAGSLPFATLLRGEHLTADVPGGGVIRNRKSWSAFWAAVHETDELPAVDFENEVVLVGVLGRRDEAGDSVEIRRVLPVQIGTKVELVERVAGDFCSPAAFPHIPFHVVVSPTIPAPVEFNAMPVERVPCPR